MSKIPSRYYLLISIVFVFAVSGFVIFDYIQNNQVDTSSNLSQEHLSDFNQNAYAAKDKLYVPKNIFQIGPEVVHTVSYTANQDKTVMSILQLEILLE